jgi:TolB-like protein/DNA-binding winged helix-turn-helix (wHTH) protein
MRDAPGSGRLEQPREAPSLLRFAGFILDLNARTLVRETGEAVALTRGEFALLLVFVTKPGRVLSRDVLLDALASRRFEPFDRSVDVMVGKLRRKIELDSKQPRLIITMPGEGYRFDGLAKDLLSGQRLTMAVPSSGNDESPRKVAPSDAPLERRAERDLLEAEAKQVSHAAIDQPKAWASKLGGLAVLWPAVAALLFLAAASVWFVATGKGAKTTEAARLSIVVLPFVNLSGDPGQDYLVDALTDELTTSLARMSGTISGVFVIARNTAMTYKGKPVDAKAIGKDLRVRYLLEGSVQPSGNQVRINAQLIDADSGAHLWAEQFDTPPRRSVADAGRDCHRSGARDGTSTPPGRGGSGKTDARGKSRRRGFGSPGFCGRGERRICRQGSRFGIRSLRAGAARRSQQRPRPVGFVYEVPLAGPIRHER